MEPSAIRATRSRASQAMDAALRAFYAADPRRGPSCERDLGLRWRSAQGATYRVAWIEDTEELYSVRHSGAGEPTTVVVLARLGAEALERILAGWRSVLGTDRPGSYEWLLDRAASARHEAAPAF